MNTNLATIRARDTTTDYIHRIKPERFSENDNWRNKTASRYPDAISKGLIENHQRIEKSLDYFLANRYLLTIAEALETITFDGVENDESIRQKAKCVSMRCKRVARNLKDASDIKPLLEILNFHEIDPPISENTNSIILRLCCERWWTKALRKKINRNYETIARNLNIVKRQKQIYITDLAVRKRRERNTRARALLKLMVAVNELGEEFTLEELQETSVSNPKLRRVELMTRIAGFDQYAKKHGYIGMFYTITCPSKMHSTHSKSGEMNLNFQSYSPRDAQNYLRDLWACIRSKLKREQCEFFGFRVAEPNHDGTPHWHLLAFIRPKQESRVSEILKFYALLEDPDEKGADKYRFKAVAIDWNRGTAASYIAKYVSKNIDGFGIDQDLYHKDAKSSAERVNTWASEWGIRQFQQFGGPSVTIWRETRKLKPGQYQNTVNEIIDACDSGDWCRYFELMGGPGTKRCEMPIQLTKIWIDKLGEYGEPIGYRIFGIEYENITIRTRSQWTVRFKNENCLIWGGSSVLSEAATPAHEGTEGGVLAVKRTDDRGPHVKGFSFNTPLEYCQ